MSAPGETCAALPGFVVRVLRDRPAQLFSVDVEEWFHSNFRSAPDVDPEGLPRRASLGVDAVLELLEETRSRATFFVLGAVAREQPGLVKRIAQAGHEIGCHSLNHLLLYEQTRADAARDLRDARALLEDTSGRPVPGFRAPSWSITDRNLWALDVVAEAGFRYDSSLFPAKNYLYGVDGVPATAYELTTPSGATLLEIPPSILKVGSLRVGVGGGFYLRALPLFVHEMALRRSLSRGGSFVAYTHPRELDPGSWALSVPLDPREHFIHTFGLRRGAARLRALLGRGQWQPLGSLLPGGEARS